jgi:RNA polymerase sigma factor (sigma-70 family)
MSSVSTILPSRPPRDYDFVPACGWDTDWPAEIERAAAGFARRCTLLTVDELRQVARIALWNACRGHEPSRGSFVRYARKAIRHAFLREMRYASDPRAQSGGAAPIHDIDEPDLAGASGSAGEPYGGRADEVRDWVQDQSPRMQQLYDCLFVNRLTQEQTAELIGVTQGRVCQLRRQLLERGRNELVALAA